MKLKCPVCSEEINLTVICEPLLFICPKCQAAVTVDMSGPVKLTNTGYKWDDMTTAPPDTKIPQITVELLERCEADIEKCKMPGVDCWVRDNCIELRIQLDWCGLHHTCTRPCTKILPK